MWCVPKVMWPNLSSPHQDLVAFAKQVDIQLLTHNDGREILPLAPLHQTLGSAVGGEWQSWRCRWVSRYNSVIKLRGIVSHRGLVCVGMWIVGVKELRVWDEWVWSRPYCRYLLELEDTPPSWATPTSSPLYLKWTVCSKYIYYM